MTFQTLLKISSIFFQRETTTNKHAVAISITKMLWAVELGYCAVAVDDKGDSNASAEFPTPGLKTVFFELTSLTLLTG